MKNTKKIKEDLKKIREDLKKIIRSGGSLRDVEELTGLTFSAVSKVLNDENKYTETILELAEKVENSLIKKKKAV